MKKKASEQAKAAPTPEAPTFLPPGAPALNFKPEKLVEFQQKYLSTFSELMTQMASGQVPPLADKRFSDPAWKQEQGGAFGWTAALYLMQSQMMQDMLGSVETDQRTLERLRFAAQQWSDAVSPANFLFTNPEAQKLNLQTKGESVKKGLSLLNDDIQRGRMSQTDEDQFEVGRNIAVTPGAVVFENELFQLLQYTPTTAKVGKRPLLMVPPCINKFYILDLQPENSLIAHAVAQGHQVFVVSWRNPDESLQHLTWDDYIELGAITAIAKTLEVAGSKDLNALGFCVGGTIVATALSVLKKRGQSPAASLTLLTTLLDFSDTGQLGMFVDEQFVQFREQTIGRGGLMPAKDLSATFSFLRPNDLVWNYVVNKYLKGEAPPAFDLLYWNADSTNLPGPMYCWYLRNTYLTNDISIPNKVQTAGEFVDFGSLDLPSFVYGSKEDHIVPWTAALRSSQLLGGETTFVLGASGHIAGVINPPAKKKRSHWTHPRRIASKASGKALSSQEWLDQAQEHAGSWWPVWTDWLAKHKNGERTAPKALGSRAFPVLESAPGRYVRERAV
jgi:polyhydroxyalkanoate synthase subunit PhaC